MSGSGPDDSVRAWAIAQATFRFHALAGARVGLRNSVVGGTVALFLLLMAPYPLLVLRALADSLAGADSPPWALWVMTILGAVLARRAAPQVLAGHSGWLRSLPVSPAVQRRAITAALVLVQVPILVFALCCLLGVVLAPGLRVAPVKVLAWAPLAVAAGLTALPAARRARVVAACVAAAALAGSGTVVGLVASPAALVTADALAGRPAVQRRRARWRSRGGLPQHIAWRAISWRALSPMLAAAVPLAGAWLFRTNNDLDPAAAAAAARIGGVIAVMVSLAGLANALHVRRPVWGWERSLPWSSQRRALHDAASLAAGVVPVWLVVVAMDIGAALAVVAVSPMFALMAAAAIRRAGARLSAAAGEVTVLGGLIVVVLALVPWSVVLCVAATPLAVRFAARRERDRPVSQWLELHHSPEGDGLSWSAR